MSQFEICNKRQSILESTGNVLIEGGPGSGKTTIALLKCRQIIEAEKLLPNQKLLFLSFARATIARVEEHADKLLQKEISKLIEINTYHGFTWSIVQSYGYLLSKKKKINLVSPPNASAMLGKIAVAERAGYQKHLFYEEGLLCFDLFAPVAAEIFMKSPKIRHLISDTYPIIIVDEFQDTNSAEWDMVKQIGVESKIVALADFEQRIYDFRGASITRIPEFKDHFVCSQFDLGKDNHRSGGTDITVYGDDVLTGKNIGVSYKNVIVNKYKRNYQQPIAPLKYELINCIKRLKKNIADNDWSIAVLTKSNKVMLNVSTDLSRTTGSLPAIDHEVYIDPFGPSLAAAIIAILLEPLEYVEECFKRLAGGTLNYLRGHRKDGPNKGEAELADAVEEYIKSGKIRGKNRKLLIEELNTICVKRSELILTGVPATDWNRIRDLLMLCTHTFLKCIYNDAKFVRLLNKGAILNELLADNWRQHGCYKDAFDIMQNALLQEHFSMVKKSFKGVYVMTMHKSKGKEFDEVIIWEDQYNPIVNVSRATVKDIEQVRLSLRVAVTRAKSRTAILTCRDEPCPLV